MRKFTPKIDRFLLPLCRVRGRGGWTFLVNMSKQNHLTARHLYEASGYEKTNFDSDIKDLTYISAERKVVANDQR